MQPRAAHRSPPCSFFCKCILRTAIDFAEWRMRSWWRGAERNAARYSAWLALHLSLTFSILLVQPLVALRSPPRSFFCTCILQGAIDFAEAAEPECEAELEQP
ncbi:MAG: hypothetical protein WA977_00505 [Halobacteriota archaeon]